jgi:SWI/SNF-related matrix-associated actin-dependent regulator 1 of chromatin subfamily A
LKYNWKKEIGMWTKYKASDVSILSGATPYPVSTRFSIINYDILPYWAETLSAARYSFVVSDECHYIQNDSAQRTQAFLEIAKKADDVIFISGTPFTSRPYQMYTALHTIAPKIFKTQKDYGNRFCNPTIERGKTVYKGASNMDVLHSILMDGICIRRLKEDVLAELPSKRRLTIAVASENAELRADAETFRKIRALEQKIAHSSDLLGTLEWQKQIAYLRKRKAVNTWIEDFLQSGKKLVVFGTHDMTLDDVMAKFGDIAVRIDGSTSQKKRNEAIDRFQHDPSVRLFVGNIRAAGVGITLTAASDALIIELPWTYSECAQAEDRVHRIGAKDSVTVWYTICPDSIDERLMDIVNQKAATHTHIFDGTEDNMMLQLKKEGGFLYHSVFGEEES